MNVVVVGDVSSQHASQVEQAAIEVGTLIRNKFRLRRIQNDQVVFKLGEK